MADVANKYPENVPGKFYVDDNTSTAICLAKRRRPISNATTTAVTPTFTSKAESPEEEALCKEAMEGCPVEAIGNDGA